MAPKPFGIPFQREALLSHAVADNVVFAYVRNHAAQRQRSLNGR